MKDLLEDEWLRNGTELPVVKSESAFAVSIVEYLFVDRVKSLLNRTNDNIK